MTVKTLGGFRYLITRAIRRHLGSRWRLRKYQAQTAPFIYRSRFGLTFELEPDQFIDRAIIADGLYEDRFVEYVASFLTPDSVVLDIGANIGNHALFLARKCAVVHCFEPNPRAWARLRRNIALNGSVNVIVHEFGLGLVDETASFYENTSGNLGSSGFVAPEGSSRVVELPVQNADRAVSGLNLPRVDFIKIDVEGMEESVLAGLSETVRRFRPTISFEFHGERVSDEDFQRIRSLLPQYDIIEPRFSPPDGSLFDRMRWNVRKAGRPDQVLVEVSERRLYENLIAVPRSI